MLTLLALSSGRMQKALRDIFSIIPMDRNITDSFRTDADFIKPKTNPGTERPS